MTVIRFQVIVVLPVRPVRLDLLGRLELQDLQVRLDLQARLELVELLGWLAHLACKETREIQDSEGCKVIFVLSILMTHLALVTLR